MLGVDKIGEIRRAHYRERRLIMKISRDLGVLSTTIRKVLLSGSTDFVYERRIRMRYAALKDKAMGIGSGIVEAANKVLVVQRMKRSGMRWRIWTSRPVVPRAAEIGLARPVMVRPEGRRDERKPSLPNRAHAACRGRALGFERKENR